MRRSAGEAIGVVRGILRILPCLWRTSNLPKEGSFKLKPSVFMFALISATMLSVTVLTTLLASRAELRLRAERTRVAMALCPTCGPFGGFVGNDILGHHVSSWPVKGEHPEVPVPSLLADCSVGRFAIDHSNELIPCGRSWWHPELDYFACRWISRFVILA